MSIGVGCDKLLNSHLLFLKSDLISLGSNYLLYSILTFQDCRRNTIRCALLVALDESKKKKPSAAVKKRRFEYERAWKTQYASFAVVEHNMGRTVSLADINFFGEGDRESDDYPLYYDLTNDIFTINTFQ